MRGDVLSLDRAGVEVLFVDLPLLGELGDVGDVDPHRPVAQRLHELVVLELLELRLIGVADDHLVNVRLGELLRLDLVLLRGTEQVIEERHVELEHLDEFDDPAVGDVELPVEVESPRVGIRAIFGDLAIVDIPGELGRVLILFVLRLKGPDSNSILLREDQAVDPNVLRHLLEIAVIEGHQIPEHEPTGGAQLVTFGDRKTGSRRRDLSEDARAPFLRNEIERLFVHRALHPLLGRRSVVGFLVELPTKSIRGSFRRP